MRNSQSNSRNSSADQRYFPRWKVENDVYFHVEEASSVPHHAKTKDINCAGACINSSHEFEPKQKVQLSIQLTSKKVVKTQGTVMWTRPDVMDRSQTGIMFDELTAEDKDLIFDQAFAIKPDEIVDRWFAGWKK